MFYHKFTTLTLKKSSRLLEKKHMFIFNIEINLHYLILIAYLFDVAGVISYLFLRVRGILFLSRNINQIYLKKVNTVFTLFEGIK